MLKTTFFLLLGAITFVSVEASAQCVDPATGTEVAEDEHNPSNRCQVCKNAEFIVLPEHTRCGEKGTALQCEPGRIFREECVLVGDEITCVEQDKGEACPNGYACEETNGVCAQECSDVLPCTPPYFCVDERCVEPDDEPDAGTMEAESTDMGTTPDVSSSTEPDAGSEDAGSETDGNQPDPPGGLNSSDDGCCAVVSGDSPGGTPLLMLLFGTLFIRRFIRRNRSPS